MAAQGLTLAAQGLALAAQGLAPHAAMAAGTMLSWSLTEPTTPTAPNVRLSGMTVVYQRLFLKDFMTFSCKRLKPVMPDQIVCFPNG